MTDEQTFLVKLLGNRFDEPAARKIDWQKFIETANSQRVIALVLRILNPFSAKLPPEIFAELQKRAQIITLGNLELCAQLIKLAKLFEANEIDFLAYKGATLAEIVWKDSSIRQFGDLDVLIRKRDFPKIKRLIVENGGKPDWNLTEKQEKAVLKYYYEYPFLIGESGSLLELHWAFTESFFAVDLKFEDVFERRQLIAVHGKNLPTLANEDLLIFLCVHGAKHFWKRLSWICDAAYLVKNQKIDRQILIRRAEKLGCLRVLKLGLTLAKDLLQVDLPLAIGENDDKIVSDLAQEFKLQMFDERFSAESARIRTFLKMRERTSDKFVCSYRLFQTKLIDSLFMPMGRPQ